MPRRAREAKEDASSPSAPAQKKSRSGGHGIRGRRWCFTLHLQRDAGEEGARLAGPGGPGQDQAIDLIGQPDEGRGSSPEEEKETGVPAGGSSSAREDGSSSSSGVGENRQRVPSTIVELRDHFLVNIKQCLFFVAQKEKCPRTGRLHFQGYARFSNQVSLCALKKWLPTAHWELSKGSEEQNIKYCTKDESRAEGEEPLTFGDAVQPGKRTDLAQVRQIIEDGGGMREVCQSTDSTQAIRCAEILLKYIEPGRNFKPEVRWYHGSTGSGKTRSAVEEFPNAWISGKNLKWWEGYDAHKEVIVDDFRKDFCTFHELLRILDRYPYRIEVKGASRQLLAKVIVITCPWPPEVLYQGRSVEDIGQLVRRIDEVRLFGDPVAPPVLFVRSADA